MEYIEKVEIITEAKPSADISRCIEDAIALALKSKTIVKMTHNCKTYTVNPIDLRKLVYETEFNS